MQDYTKSSFGSNVSHRELFYIDDKGNIIVDVSKFDEAGSFQNGLAAVRKGSRYGYIDKLGNLVIKTTYFQAFPFHENLAAVKIKEKPFFDSVEGDEWAYIDSSGKIAIQGQFDAAYNFSEGIALVKRKNEFFFIDKNGRKLAVINADKIRLEYSGNQMFSDGLIVACEVETEKCGFMDKTGRFIIAPEFQNAANFSEGLARVLIKSGGKDLVGFIDRSGNYVIHPRFDVDSDFQRCSSDFSDGLVGLIDAPATSNFIFLDSTGQTALQTEYFYAGPFSNGLAPVFDRTTDKWGYINKSGKLNIPLKFNSASSFSDGLAIVSILN